MERLRLRPRMVSHRASADIQARRALVVIRSRVLRRMLATLSPVPIRRGASALRLLPPAGAATS